MVEMKLNTIQDVLQQVEQICDAPEGDLRAWLHKEVLLNALKFKRDDLETLDLKIINRAMEEISLRGPGVPALQETKEGVYLWFGQDSLKRPLLSGREGVRPNVG